MSFRSVRTKFLDLAAPFARRRYLLRNAVELYAYLTKTSFESVWSELTGRHGLRSGTLVDAAGLARAFEELDLAREAFLVQLRGYERRRREEKRLGRRAPRHSAARELYASPTLGARLRSSPAGREE